MLNIKNKDLIMLGVVFGIALFFVGAIINNIFPSSESDLLSYKVSASIKLIGMGFLTSSMVVGGIIIEDIDKNIKILLLLLGLLILVIYTVGAPSLHWDVSTFGMASTNESYENRPTGYGIPGFELVYAIIGVVFISYLIRKNKK
jgi:hypothetical protein